MNMTQEEVTKRLKALKARCERLIVSSSAGNPEEWRKDAEAIDMAITALRPVSRERVEKVPRCEHCKDGKSFDGQVVIMGNKGMFPLNFCPRCGSPLTDEAVEMVMERLETLNDAD